MNRERNAALLTACALSLFLLSPLPAEAKTKSHIGKTSPQVEERYAPASDHRTTPLMVIRFNQRKVYYERPLYEAVSRAVDAKSGVRFLLVSHVPENGEDTAERNLDKVYRTFTDMGVPASRIAVERQEDRGVSDSEVHVFVR